MNFKKRVFDEEDALQLELNDDLNLLQATMEKIKAFRHDCKSIVKLTTLEEIDTKSKVLDSSWIDCCKKYFYKHLRPHAKNNLDKFDQVTRQSLELSYRNYNLKNNMSESMNCSFKRFNAFKILTLDMLILSSFNFNCEKIEEFNRSKCGLGDYTMKPEFKSLKKLTNFNYWDFPDRIKLSKSEFLLENKNQSTLTSKQISQVKIAELIIQRDLVEYSNKFKCYYVKSPFDNQPYSVRKEGSKLVCNCLSGRYNCCHSKAVDYYLNGKIKSFTDPSQMNLSNQLNKRNKNKVKPGDKGDFNPEELQPPVKSFQPNLSEDEKDEIHVKVEQDEIHVKVEQDEIQVKVEQDEVMKKDAIESELDYDFDCVVGRTFWLHNDHIEFYANYWKANTKNGHLSLFVESGLDHCSIRTLIHFLNNNFNSNKQNVIVPFNRPKNVHWLVGFVNVTSSKIYILDSMLHKKEITKHHSVIDKESYGDIFKKLLLIYNCCKLISGQEATLPQFILPYDYPQQKNQHDCGVFACEIIKLIINRKSSRFFIDRYKVQEVLIKNKRSLSSLDNGDIKPLSDPLKEIIHNFEDAIYPDINIQIVNLPYLSLFDDF